MPTETPEPTAALADARRALRCLYVQVPEEVARDVGTKVEAAFAALATAADRAAQAERLKIAREAARLSKRDDMSDEQALEALLGVYNDCLSFQTDCAGCAAATSRDYDVQCRIDDAADRARREAFREASKSVWAGSVCMADAKRFKREFDRLAGTPDAPTPPVRGTHALLADDELWRIRCDVTRGAEMSVPAATVRRLLRHIDALATEAARARQEERDACARWLDRLADAADTCGDYDHSAIYARVAKELRAATPEPRS
jgi:hypothetical protein